MGRLLASFVSELPPGDQELLADYAAALRRAGYREERLPSTVSRNSSPESSGASTIGNHLWAAGASCGAGDWRAGSNCRSTSRSPC